MSDIPPTLLARLAPAAIAAARDWWARLAESDRDEVIALCSSQGWPPDAPKVVGGRFLPDDDAAGWTEWMAAYFEYLIAQPDPALYEPPYFRIFHIG